MSVYAPLASVSTEFHALVTRCGTTTVVEIEGDLDLSTIEAARGAFSEAVDQEPAFLVMDFTRVAFMDSTGVHFVIEADSRAARAGSRLVVIPGDGQPQRLFELCRLADRVQLAPMAEPVMGADGRAPATIREHDV